jgi:acetoin:2,6-dichlorophenolindophenol oxidoreductase subunit alpha
MTIPAEKLLWMYERMVMIREFETTVRAGFLAGKLPGFIHLYIGEEAVAAGVCAALRIDDYVFSTHRGHGHCVAKGCEPRLMLAELAGKLSGYCKGKGGSMHICDMSNNMMGTSGIVGGNIPLANGAALTAKLKKTGQVSVCFFGDAATNQGSFHESLNLAAVWDLPTLFILENNSYAQSTPVEYSAKITDLAERAKAYGIPGIVIDGMDAREVYEKAQEAVEGARKGGSPVLLECKTYRFGGHYEGDPGGYRTDAEIQAWRERDPIDALRRRLIDSGTARSTDLDKIHTQCRETMTEAEVFAYQSPLPNPELALEDVYVSY